MSAIGDIAFGQNTSDEEWNAIKDRWPYNPNAPRPISDNINLDPELKKIKETRILLKHTQEEQPMNTSTQEDKKVTATTTIITPNSTDEVVSLYESKLNQRVSSKILHYSETGVPPTFTEEETAYLKKKSENTETDDVKIIVDESPITLKKGNTEINIKNAASLVKRMEKIYPSNSQDTASKAEEFQYKDPQVDMGIPLKDKSHVLIKGIFDTNEFERKQHNVQKQSGKNAYELRTDILGYAIDVIKLSDIATADTSGKINCHVLTDRVLNIASRFYVFVENKR